MNAELIDALKHDEGLRLRPYKDSREIWTIGYGHNLESGGISLAVAEQILIEDATIAEQNTLVAWPWAKTLDQARLNALINMVFNMGLERVRGFKNFLAALEKHDYQAAAEHMLDSAWAKQVGVRATRLAAVIRGS